jgi:hypothetical protein
MQAETFRWRHKTFDISAALKDLERGHLHPTIVELEPAFIEGYCNLYLDTASPEPRPPIAIDQEYADGLSVERLSEPIILLHVGESEGLVSLREDIPEPHYVVGDGNHRLLAAKRLRAILRAYVLTAEESASYELPFA